MINPTITISQNEYEYLVEQAKIVKFIEHYKPSICNDGEFGTYEMVVGSDGLITTVRYGTLSECVKCAIEDIRAMQSVYWVGEETEILCWKLPRRNSSCVLFRKRARGNFKR